jgi:hypothetical protein
MSLSESERHLFRDLAFFAEDGAFPGVEELRPLSILSMKAMEMMGLALFQEKAEDLTPERELQEINVWLWLHTAPLAEVCSGLWDGTWRGILVSDQQPAEVIVAEFRRWHVRVLAMLEACAVDIRPRPKSKGDDTPRDIWPPSRIAFMVSMIAHHSNMDREKVKWHFFLPEALQEFHCAMRWNGQWTVKPGEEVSPEDLMDLTPSFLGGQGTEEGTEG